MAESALELDPSWNKATFYSELNRQLKVVLEGENNLIARLSMIAATLGETKRFLWSGFYLVDGAELVLGPYSGPLPCFRIAKGRGVCGVAWARNEDLLVPNVHDFPGHIACSSLSNSEVVVPLRDPRTQAVIGVLDVDHVDLGGMDADDLAGLRALADLSVV